MSTTSEDVAKSKEQLEAEKKAILTQRIEPLNIGGFDTSKLAEKAKEIHQRIYDLESEKYDLEQRYKKQQLDMMELSERARQMNKGKKKGAADSQFDRLSDKYSQAPPKVLMFSKYERQTDSRKFGERMSIFQKDKAKAGAEITETAAEGEAPAQEE